MKRHIQDTIKEQNATREVIVRRPILVLGACLSIIALILMIIGSVKLKDVKLEVVGKSDFEVWQFSANLSRGKTYILEIEYGTEWGQAFTQMGTDSPQPVNVTIISPSGNGTKLEAFFTGEPSQNPYMPVTALAIAEVRYFKVDSDSLQVYEPSPRIRVTVKQEGNYTARVIEEELNWASGPPNQLLFYEEVPDSSFLLLLQLGGPVFLVGFVVSIWGFRTTKRLRVKKKGLSRKNVAKIKSCVL